MRMAIRCRDDDDARRHDDNDDDDGDHYASTNVRVRKVTAPLLAKRLEKKMNDATHPSVSFQKPSSVWLIAFVSSARRRLV